MKTLSFSPSWRETVLSQLRYVLMDYLGPLGVAGLLIVTAMLITWSIHLHQQSFADESVPAAPQLSQMRSIPIPLASMSAARAPKLLAARYQVRNAPRVVKVGYAAPRLSKAKSRHRHVVKRHRHHRTHHHPRVRHPRWLR